MNKSENQIAKFSTIYHFHWSDRYPDSDQTKQIILEGIETKEKEQEMILELFKEHFPEHYFEGMEIMDFPSIKHDEYLPFETERVYTLYSEDYGKSFDVQIQPIMIVNERKFILKEL